LCSYQTGHSSSAIQNICRTHAAHPSQLLSLAFTLNAKSFLENETHHIAVKWIAGHNGHEINEEADILAKKGCRSEEEVLPPTLSFHAENFSKNALKKWREDFSKNRSGGAFGEVTTCPPTRKPDKVFFELADQPEFFGRLTQVRTMHGYNQAYYHKIHLDKDLTCVRGPP